MKCLTRKIAVLLLLALVSPLAAIGPGEVTAESAETAEVSTVSSRFHATSLQHTQGFDVTYGENFKVLTVSEPWPGADADIQYLLVERGTPVPAGYADAQVIDNRQVFESHNILLPFLSA